MPEPSAIKPEERSRKLRIQYQELCAKYASQVLLNATPEEVLLDFSSGMMSDPGSNDSILPVHTRIAMSIPAAQRLAQLLNQALSRKQEEAKGAVAPMGDLPATSDPARPRG